MRIPIVQGVIDRRILTNYRVDPEIVSRILPSPFRPLLVQGHAIAGICLIRLSRIRPQFLPMPWGLSSENAAHRIAVEWDQDGRTQQGVYVPRRDTNSRLNAWLGGRLFPGLHQHAEFRVAETAEQFSVALRSDDGATRVRVEGRIASELPETSVFSSLAEASSFFERGTLGYSATHAAGRFDGLELKCRNWRVEPLDVTAVESSFFDDHSRFPPGSVEFDCALLMRGVEHEWHGRGELCCRPERPMPAAAYSA